MRFKLLLHFLCLILCEATIFDQTSKGKCIPIDIDLCKDLPYNYTYYPNTILHNEEHSLQTHTEHFKPLMKTKCHPHIHFFICSVFAPMCPTAMPQAVTSCRSVCEKVKEDCVSILEEFGIGWPEPLNCAHFPDPPDLCMKPTEDEIVGNTRKTSTGVQKPSGCPSDLIDIDPMDPKGHCAFGCTANVMFNTENKRTTRAWSIWFAAANSLISLFAFLTFSIDRKRFRFPERCVLYLSLCIFLSSLPYILPIFVQPVHRSCIQPSSSQQHPYLSIGSYDNAYCLTSFLLNYFFSTAAALWWLMFSFTLYLSGGRKWVPEGIESCSSYVHFVAWGLSALATIVVLIFNKVDASELTALCSVGNLNSLALLWFVIVPRTICLVLGAAFIIGGFASMCRERISFRQRGTDTSKLEKLMLKMGLFCALFILPTVVELVCQSYNFLILTQWIRATVECKLQTGACHRPMPPQAEIYMIAIWASLSTGVSCLMWVLSAKTVGSWKKFLFCGMCSTAPVKQNPTHAAEPSTRPLLEPPTAPPPQPPVYMQMTTNPSQTSWRPSKVV